MSVFDVAWKGVWLTLQRWRPRSKVHVSLPSATLSATVCDISVSLVVREVVSQSGYRHVWVVKHMLGSGGVCT